MQGPQEMPHSGVRAGSSPVGIQGVRATSVACTLVKRMTCICVPVMQEQGAREQGTSGLHACMAALLQPGHLRGEA